MIIEGNVSVKAALLGNRREVIRLIGDPKKKDRDTAFIYRRAEERNIPVEFMERVQIDALAKGHTHGGLLAECGNRQYQELDACLGKDAFLCLLEGVEDPYNLGYVIRTLYSAGCTGLILRKRDWSAAESTILRASAGAFEYLNIVLSDDMSASLRQIRESGVSCFAAMRSDRAVPYTEAPLKKPVLLAIGGEMRGLSSGVRKEIDTDIYIPYANDFRNALNAAAAAAVLAYEVVRQNP